MRKVYLSPDFETHISGIINLCERIVSFSLVLHTSFLNPSKYFNNPVNRKQHYLNYILAPYTIFSSHSQVNASRTSFI